MFADSFTFVDLFAGIGGFHHALADLGGTCVLAVEIDESAQRVYKRAFPETPLRGDITAITRAADGSDRTLDDVAAIVTSGDPGVSVDVVCAGFPCQPFSKSGSQLGVRDRTRGTLFFDVMTVVLATRPRFVMLENVRNLAGPRHRETWATITESLRDAGYRVPDDPLVFSPHLLPPELGGAPQVRDRVFILAERVDEGSEEERVGEVLVPRAPVGGWDPASWNIEEILDADEDIEAIERYRLRDEEQGWIEAWQAFVQSIPAEVLPGFPIWVDAFRKRPIVPEGTPAWKRDFLEKNSRFYAENEDFIRDWLKKRWGPRRQRVHDFPPSRRKFEWQARSLQQTRAQRDLNALVLHLRPSGIRVKPPTYLPALVAITQTSVIGSRMRRITPREAARLQGMPDAIFAHAGVSDKEAYKQLGNAVNVGVVRYLAQVMFAAARPRSAASVSA